ncbi:MAG: lipid A deacylase LpxR family protein [bacterium]
MALALACPSQSGGQELSRTVRVSVENDYFDFWLPPDKRSDDNYTHGMRIGWDAIAVPAFARAAICGKRACGSTFEIGQEIYTPTDDAVLPIPGQRPYAGWLYARASAIAASDRTRREVGVTLGVTGAPSLAAQTQEIFHHLITGFRTPLGWNQQLSAEPAIAVSASQTWLFSAPGSAGRWGDVAPAYHAEIGTLRTSVAVGGRMRTGLALTHPWLVDSHARPWEAYVFVGGQTEAVGRDLFLDGNTFHRSVRVDHTPLVSTLERGIGVRLWRLGVEYRAVTSGREYRTGPPSHSFGGIGMVWSRGR